MIVYNANPLAIAPDSDKVAQGFAREDLFTVVLEHFQTDTADYADILLPATTQLEHVDVHSAYGHLYMMANNAGHRAAGRSQAEHRNLPPAGRAHGLRRPLLQRERRPAAAAGLRRAAMRARSISTGSR